jgi:hypothetical protein
MHMNRDWKEDMVPFLDQSHKSETDNGDNQSDGSKDQTPLLVDKLSPSSRVSDPGSVKSELTVSVSSEKAFKSAETSNQSIKSSKSSNASSGPSKPKRITPTKPKRMVKPEDRAKTPESGSTSRAKTPDSNVKRAKTPDSGLVKKGNGMKGKNDDSSSHANSETTTTVDNMKVPLGISLDNKTPTPERRKRSLSLDRNVANISTTQEELQPTNLSSNRTKSVKIMVDSKLDGDGEFELTNEHTTTIHTSTSLDEKEDQEDDDDQVMLLMDASTNDGTAAKEAVHTFLQEPSDEVKQLLRQPTENIDKIVRQIPHSQSQFNVSFCICACKKRKLCRERGRGG